MKTYEEIINKMAQDAMELYNNGGYPYYNIGYVPYIYEKDFDEVKFDVDCIIQSTKLNNMYGYDNGK